MLMYALRNMHFLVVRARALLPLLSGIVVRKFVVGGGGGRRGLLSLVRVSQVKEGSVGGSVSY